MSEAQSTDAGVDAHTETESHGVVTLGILFAAFQIPVLSRLGYEAAATAVAAVVVLAGTAVLQRRGRELAARFS